MGSIPGVRHLQAIRAFEKAGFRIMRQSGHVIMSKGALTLTIPRNNQMNASTMSTIVKDRA